MKGFKYYTMEQKATLFGSLMFVLIALSICTAFITSDPLILGTEINTNGQMEYLCLGLDCERIFNSF